MSRNGAIGHYVHGQIADGLGRIGVIVALESTGDRGALVALGRQVAMHVAAASPIALDPAGHRSGDDRARKVGAGREERRQAAARAGKDRRIGPQDLSTRRSASSISPIVHDPAKSVAQAVKEAEKTVGAPIAVAGFVRYALGEGVEKPAEEA